MKASFNPVNQWCSAFMAPVANEIASVPSTIFLNALDDCLVTYLDGPAFDDNLVNNVLFQSRVVFHEASVFDSTLLARHLDISRKKGRTSFFEKAAARGLLLPAFVYGPQNSMGEAFNQLQERYGQQYRLLIDPMKKYKNAIIDAVDVGLSRPKKLERVPVAVDAPVRYLALMRHWLQREAAPIDLEGDDARKLMFDVYWPITKPWRFDLLEEAVELTRAKGRPGLQRAELLNALGWAIGVPRDNTRVTMQDVLKALPAKQEGNPLRLATILFIRWITQIHQMNTASLVGADADLLVYDVGEDFLFDTLDPPKKAALEATSKMEKVDPISIRLPSLDWLLHEGADTAIQVRNEYGVEYLAALVRWQRNPSEEAFDDVKNTISAYCANICRGAHVTFDGWL